MGRASLRVLAAVGAVVLVPAVVLVDAPLLRAALGIATLLLLGLVLRRVPAWREAESGLELVPAPRPADGRVRELEHRLKNLLATVSGVLDQVRSRGDDAEHSLVEFERRLGELRRLHEALSEGAAQGSGIALRDLLSLALEPFAQSAGEERVEFDGPRVEIPRQAILPLGTALCELTTNALKYGALSNGQGHVRIAWDVLRAAALVEGEGTVQPGVLLRLDWIESDGPRVLSPERRGYGTVMLERGLAYEMDGHVELEFDEAGLRCRMDLPFAALECEPGAILIPAPNRAESAKNEGPRGALPARPGGSETPTREANGAV